MTDMCSRPEFDLMRCPSSLNKDGASMLRLSMAYDHTRMPRSPFNFHAIDASTRLTVSPLRQRRPCQRGHVRAAPASRRTPSRGASVHQSEFPERPRRAGICLSDASVVSASCESPTNFPDIPKVTPGK